MQAIDRKIERLEQTIQPSKPNKQKTIVTRWRDDGPQGPSGFYTYDTSNEADMKPAPPPSQDQKGAVTVQFKPGLTRIYDYIAPE